MATRSRKASCVSPFDHCETFSKKMFGRRPQERPDYMYHPSFDDPSQEAVILGPMPGAETYEALRQQIRVPDDVAPELLPLYTPLLSKEQEQHQFRKMNFLKHQAAQLRYRLRFPTHCMDASAAQTQALDAVTILQRQAKAVLGFLVNCNTRLLMSIVKRYATRADNFSELLSDGHLLLISAVEKFDYSRGNKFSTYASSVILQNFARGIVKEKERRRRYLTGRDAWFFESTVDTRSDEKASLDSAEQVWTSAKQLLQLLEFLDPRERDIVRLRLGLVNNAKRMTLENIGKRLGVTKERVRQLQARSLEKLRNLAAAYRVERP
jgi:RNA polymerase sigma factor (sigma-70 family)